MQKKEESACNPKTCIKGPKGSHGRIGPVGERGPNGPRVSKITDILSRLFDKLLYSFIFSLSTEANELFSCAHILLVNLFTEIFKKEQKS